MDLETAQTNTTAKLPLLKQGEYDMWKLRIKQYFQVQDYALWDVIENGNSFKLAAQTTTNVDGSSTTLIPGPVTADEKYVKARSMLLMALPNKHLLTFNQYKDAKTLFAAIQTRFGEDLNLKFLRSLPSEWNTHVVVWRNKPDLDTMSFDDLYNNFKIVKQEVKGTASSSSSSSSQNLAFVTQVSTANLSDDTVYAFLASQPNRSHLVHEDLEQIHEDDLEEMDLKWQLALLSMRTKIFLKNGRQDFIYQLGVTQLEYDTSKEARIKTALRMTNKCGKKFLFKSMVAIDDGFGTRALMAEEEIPTDMALMAFSDIEATSPISQTSKHLMEDMLHLGEEPKEEELLMCDKKNSVLFTDTGCFILSPDFKLADKSKVLLKVPRKNNIYSVDMKNVVPKKILTCLVVKATLDESMLWHKRLGHVNFKTINKLVKDNLVRGLPSKHFENDQTCVACLKGKQHKASCKSKIQNSISQPLFMLHMDLFGPTFMSSLMNKKYCLVVTDDYSRFTWVFFLASKDETSGILKSFITQIENLVDKKVKIIRCDNGTEFKNRVMSEFCEKKGIKKEFSIARTPQQNGVAERRNRTLIEAARTMLADSKLPTTFWAEAVNTACYVQNRVLVVKPHNKTPYELFRGRTPSLSFMKPFGCHVTILNTLDHLGKFDGKSDDGFFVGYSLNSKAFRVYNIRTRKVEENLHVRFLEDKPIVAGDGPKWLFDIDVLTESMNYVPVVAGTNSNDFIGNGYPTKGRKMKPKTIKQSTEWKSVKKTKSKSKSKTKKSMVKAEAN
ncbi:putative ribonuclease H-like domain-containing protein [Tanacetum coccineum]